MSKLTKKECEKCDGAGFTDDNKTCPECSSRGYVYERVDKSDEGTNKSFSFGKLHIVLVFVSVLAVVIVVFMTLMSPMSPTQLQELLALKDIIEFIVILLPMIVVFLIIIFSLLIWKKMEESINE